MAELEKRIIDTHRVDIWNIKVNLLKKEEIIHILNEWICSGRKGCYFTPIDANTVMLAQKDSKLREAILNSDITNVDSYLPAKFLKKAGANIEERVATPDVLDLLLDEANKKSQRIYFLGATDNTLNKLSHIIKERFPQIIIAGMHNGYFKDNEKNLIVQHISSLSPDIVLIGMPSPKKENFVMECKDNINAGALYCVGGALDALAGVLPRPPRWLRKGPMEGILRVVRNPHSYWGRAIICFQFIKFAKKWNKSHNGLQIIQPNHKIKTTFESEP